MNAYTKIKISLDEKDFKELVTGKIITVQMGETEIQISLQDIGFHNIFQIIRDQLIQ